MRAASIYHKADEPLIDDTLRGQEAIDQLKTKAIALKKCIEQLDGTLIKEYDHKLRAFRQAYRLVNNEYTMRCED